MRGVLTVVLPSTLMLTTEGITFSSIGAKLGSCWVLDEAVSAALAVTGPIAIPILNASALRTNAVFICVSLIKSFKRIAVLRAYSELINSPKFRHR